MRLPEQVRVAGVDGIGHLILDEAPEQVERLARPFLAS